MATFKFLKQNNGASILKDGVEIHNVTKPLDVLEPNAEGTGFVVGMAGLSLRTYYISGNTIVINSGSGDVDVTANTLSQICDNLRDNIFIF